METANQRLKRLLEENNLTLSLDQFPVKKVDSGEVIIGVPQLLVAFTDPKKEEHGREEQPAQ